MEKPRVIFLCTGNSARSQMAEALLRRYGGDRFEACSAGLEPKAIHPLTIQVMAEVGVSLEGHHAKPLSEFLARVPVRYAIVVCEEAEKACPRIWPFGAAVLTWPFDDPAAYEGSRDARLEKFRAVREQIDARVRQWLAEEGA